MAAAEVLLAHDIPVAFAVHAVPTQMSSFEVVERGAAAGIVITASHNPWVDNGFKVKAPTGAAAGADILGVIEARLAVNGGIGIDRRPFADAEAAGLVERFDPYDGYERFVRHDGRPRRAQGRRRVDPGRPDVGRRERLDLAPAGRRPDPGQRDPPGAQPVSSAASTPSRSGRTSTRRWPILAGGGYDLGLLPRRRRRPGGRGRRARHVHPPAPGHRAADVLPGRAPRAARPGRRQHQQHLDGRAARRALRDRRPTRRRSASSSSARR